MSKAQGTVPEDFDNESEAEGPVSSFQSYAAEGDILAKQGDYKKAIEAYSKALTLRPTEKNCLVSRSKCYLQLGDSQAALTDADASLKEDSEFFKGKFQKAEALYAKGDFEMALVYYHRGHKLRPELDEFRLGIQKAREAIDNSIGNPKDYKLHSPGSWTGDKSEKAPTAVGNVPAANISSPIGGAAVAKSVGISAPEKQRTARVPATSMAGELGRGGTKKMAPATAKAGDRISGTASADASEKTIKQLLGELYADKEYLQRLYNDRDFINNPNIYDLVSDGLKYLETRTDFWRQQKPMYARKKEQSRIQAKVSRAKHRQAASLKKAADGQTVS